MASHRFSARAYLLGLIAVAVVPVWAFATYLLISYALSEQQDYRRTALQLAGQAASIVDGELNMMLTRLDGLARSSALAEADFAELHAEARRLVSGTRQVVVLRQMAGRQIFSTEAAFGTVLPPDLPKASLLPFKERTVQVSAVYRDPATGEPRVAVARPITLARGDTLLLAITIPTVVMHEVLKTVVPQGWVVGVGDRDGVYVTRSERHEQVSGKPGLPDYLEKAAGTSGTFIATNQFGDTLLAGYARSGLSGWLFGANVPLAVVEAPLWRSFVMVALAGAVTMALSLLLAYAVGRRLTHETSALAARAIALGSGRPLQPMNTRLVEFAAINEALIAAQSMLRTRTSELEAVLETAPVAVWFTYDPSARLVIRNRFAAELMGLDHGDRTGFGYTDSVIDTTAFKDGREVPREDRPLSRAMRGESTDHEEFAYYLPDGTERFLLSSARPIYDGARQRVIGAVQISLDISDRKRAEQQRQLLARELDHRVKNNLAVVQALAQQTLRNAGDLKEASAVLSARLAAMARAQDLLTRSAWAEGDLREVIEANVLVQARAERVALSGPTVKLTPRLVMSVTLAMHELTTNAVKYGALREGRGRVAISWRVESAAGTSQLHLQWRESGGPPVAQPDRLGFGSRLLQQVAVAEQGTTKLDFAGSGVCCEIVLPLGTAAAAIAGADGDAREKAEPAVT